jgi:PAS domain S-box-containing protein
LASENPKAIGRPAGTAEEEHRDLAAPDTRRRAHRLRAVAAAAPGVVGAASPEALQRALKEACRRVVPFDALSIYAYDTAAGVLRELAEPGPDGAGAPERTPVDGTLWEQVVRGRRSLRTHTTEEPGAQGVPLPDAGSRPASAIFTPILAGGEVLGVLALESAAPDRYTAEDVEVAEGLAALAAAALAGIRLAEERRAAEHARHVSETRFRAMFEQFPLSVQIFDPEGWTLDVNRAWHALFRLTREQLGDFNPLRDPQLEDVRAYLHRGFAGETVTIPAHPFAADAGGGKPGPPRWVEVTVCPVRGPEGEIREVIVVHHDVTERVEAEEALQRAHDELERRVEERTAALAQAEARFRAIVEASPTPLLLSRIADGVILYANDRLEALIGAEPGTLMGRKTPDFYFDPSDRPQVLQTIQKQGYVRDMELRIRRVDGTPRWVSLTVQRMLFDGEPALATSLLDVTERKQTEEALRASEESYRGLFDNLTELVYIQDLEGRFLNVNEAVVRTYGYRREELTGKTPDLLAAPGLVDVERVMAQFAKAVAGEPQRFEWWGRRKDGSIFPKEVSIQRSTYFGEDVVIAVARDISDRVAAVTALRNSEEHFRRLIEHASDIITILSAEGVVQYQSPAVTRVLGYAQDELDGQNVFAYLPSEDVAPTLERLRRVVEHPGTQVTAEFRFRHKDGSWRLLEGVGATLSPTSADEGVVVNSRDITERRLAEAALRESEALKRGIVESALDCIITIDGDGHVLEFNPAAERTFGYRADEALGRKMVELIVPPHLRAAHTAGLARYGETREAHVLGQRIEVPAVRADGTEFPVELAIDAVLLEDGREVFTAYLRDISERKKAEAALRQSEEHFRRLIDNAHDMIIVVAPDGALLYASPATQRVLGWGPEETSGMGGLPHIHPEDLTGVTREMERIARDPRATAHLQYRFQHRDGAWLHLEAFGKRLDPGDPAAGIVFNVRDVTERVEAERRVRLQKTLLEAEGEASIDGILVISEEGSILSYNARFVELWRLPPEVVASRSDEAAIQAVLDQVRDPQAFQDRIAHLYAHPDEEARDEIVLRDGRVFDRYSAPVRSSDGEHFGRIWFFRDITPQKRYAEELEQARYEAEQAREQASQYAASLERSLEELRATQAHLVQSEKMASLGRLTAGIAHEIKNPLNFVNNFAALSGELVGELREALAAHAGALEGESAGLFDALRDNVVKIEEHGRRANAIIQGMMDHARSGSEERVGKRRPVNLNALVEARVALTVESHRPLDPARAVRLLRDYGDVGTVEADPESLGRVVQSLLSNAFDAVEERAAREAADGTPTGSYTPTITVRTRREGATVTIAVSDNGDGIDEQVRDRVFEPFFTTKPAGSGHPGLGLSLAHETVVTGYGGLLDVESAKGAGTTFTVTLPAL